MNRSFTQLQPSPRRTQILLLGDETKRGNLPALAYVFWPAVLSKQDDHLAVAAEQRAEAIESEAESPEGGESPLEIDTLSTAWMLQISRPLDEVLAARQISSQEVEGGSTLPAQGLGAPPRAALTSGETKEAGYDPILEIEQELFAPTHEITEGHSRTDALGRTAHVRENIAAGKTGAPSPSEHRKTMPGLAAASAHVRLLLRPTGGLGRSMPRAASNDPLAPIKAMTEEERIALFT
jgi:hypothetical protein